MDGAFRNQCTSCRVQVSRRMGLARVAHYNANRRADGNIITTGFRMKPGRTESFRETGVGHGWAISLTDDSGIRSRLDGTI